MKRIRVLLVDKNSAFMDAAACFLAEDPELTVVGKLRSTCDVLEQVALLRPDVVLMELEMPQMSGLVTALRLKSLEYTPQTVIVTARTEPPYRALAESIPTDGFVAKRDFCTEIVPLIKRLVATDEVQAGGSVRHSPDAEHPPDPQH